MSDFLGENFDLLAGVNDIREKTILCGYEKNPGGMDVVSGGYLYLILKKIQPMLFLESGIWRGYSSMIFDSINDYGASHYLFDPGIRDANFMNLLKYKVNKGHYHDADIGSSLFSSIGRNGTFFFDDHQDQLERLLIAFSRGAKYAIFDDNYMFGGGGHSSLFDHFRQGRNSTLLNAIVDSVYIAQPLLTKNKGIEPLFNTENEIDIDLIKYDANFQWLTLVKLKEIDSISKSQGSIKF